jgi:tetratricopeptide (TPR) repeat protein
LEAAAKAGWERPSALFLKRLAAGAATPEGGGRDPVTPVEPPKAADPCKAGNAKLAEGDFDGAAAEYGRGIEDKEPARAADAMLGVSAAWLGKGDTAKAARWIRMAYGAEPGVLDRAGAEKTFGPGDLFRRKLPDLARAAADVDAARQAGKEPTEADHETWFLCGCCLCLAGRPEEAAERFNEIILQWAEADAAARELYLKLKKKN